MELRTWTDIAVVFLSIQCFIIMLIPLGLTFVMVRGMNIAGSALPEYLTKAQGYTRIMRDQTVNASDKISAPLVRARAQQARVEGSLRSFSKEIGDTVYGPCEPDSEITDVTADTQGVRDES